MIFRKKKENNRIPPDKKIDIDDEYARHLALAHNLKMILFYVNLFLFGAIFVAMLYFMLGFGY